MIPSDAGQWIPQTFDNIVKGGYSQSFFSYSFTTNNPLLGCKRDVLIFVAMVLLQYW